MSRSLLLCKFDSTCTRKGFVSADDIRREANIFWAWATAKGYTECPFPEYLALFAQGKWCPFQGHISN
jgi:hypothetical protein